MESIPMILATMRSLFCKSFAAAILLLLTSLLVDVGAAPVRMAIIPAEDALLPTCDLLTAELSKAGQFALLERAQIDKVVREQGISASGSENIIKLGHVLGADGLLVLETTKQEGGEL